MKSTALPPPSQLHLPKRPMSKGECLVAPLILAACLCACATTPDPSSDLRQARALFERNITAIQERDKEAYLDCYRQTDALVRAGPEGLKMGFAELATTTPTTASDAWPSKLLADDVQVQWIRPGVVYGAYRYTVVIAGVESTGLSERVLVEEDGRWRIAVTTAFPMNKPQD